MVASFSGVRISQRLKSAFEVAIAKLNKYHTIMVASPTYLVTTGWILVQSLNGGPKPAGKEVPL